MFISIFYIKLFFINVGRKKTTKQRVGSGWCNKIYFYSTLQTLRQNFVTTRISVVHGKTVENAV